MFREDLLGECFGDSGGVGDYQGRNRVFSRVG